MIKIERKKLPHFLPEQIIENMSIFNIILLEKLFLFSLKILFLPKFPNIQNKEIKIKFHIFSGNFF